MNFDVVIIGLDEVGAKNVQKTLNILIPDLKVIIVPNNDKINMR